MDKQKKTYSLRMLCKVMEVGKSAFYQWSVQRLRVKPTNQLLLEHQAVELFNNHKKTLGSRRLGQELNKLGVAIGRFKTRRLMKQLGLVARYPKRYKATTDSDHEQSVAPNLLKLRFKVSNSNSVWTTDITAIWTHQGWLYLAVVLDLYSRQLIGGAMAGHMKTSLCLQALQMAYWRRKPGRGVIHHSDQCSQYTSHLYRQQLVAMGMETSMSGKGQCWDNAPTERFFRSLKYEQLNYEVLTTRKEAHLSVLEYLVYYNSKRPHSALGYLTPMQYEQYELSKVA
ncbi:MAG: IS3 family transposase [Candidatus Symbiodolus clandestinus]